MKRIIGGKIYDTRKAVCIADDEFSDGNNRLTHGRATKLYKTPKGRFFLYHETYWQGEDDTIEPLTPEEAKAEFEQLSGDPDDWPEEFGDPEEA